MHERARTGVSRSLTQLGRVVVVALMVNALAQFVGLIAELVRGEGLNVPHLIIGVLVAGAAAFAATGKRWGVPIGVFIVLVTNALMITQPTNSTALSHPGADAGHFVVLVIALASTIIAVVVGLIDTFGIASRGDQLPTQRA
jgi:hypothetical protein